MSKRLLQFIVAVLILGISEINFEEDVSCGKKTINVLCGFGKTDQDDEKTRALEEHIRQVQSLKQSTAAHVLLTFWLVVILLIGIFLYFFWSYWEYKPGP